MILLTIKYQHLNSSLLGITVGIKSAAIGLKICAIIAGIEKCKLTIKKKKRKHDKIVLSPKYKLYEKNQNITI